MSGLTVYPVPAMGTNLHFRFVLSSSMTVRVRVLDAQGVLVADVTESCRSGTNLFTLNISAFSAGVYYYQIDAGGQSGPLGSFTVVH